MRTRSVLALTLAAGALLPASGTAIATTTPAPAPTPTATNSAPTAPRSDVPARKTIATPRSYRDNGITAHRGFSGGHPENTLEALQAGIDLGADWIETDVHTTKDGVLVVLHDTTTGRTAGIDRVVRETTWAELQQLDVNTEYRDAHGLSVEQVPPQRMPLLSEVLDLVAKQNRTRVQLQPKDEPSTAAAVKMIQDRGMQAQVGFNDGNLAKMSLVKKLDPSIYVFWDTPARGDLEEEIRIATERGFDALVMNQARVTPESIQRVQQAGFDAGAWTVNDTETIRTFLSWGLDRLYTDHPDRALLLAGEDDRKGLANQLLSYWAMDKADKFGTTPDLGSPNPLRDGRLIGDAQIVHRGRHDHVLRLDGRGDRVDVPLQVLPDKPEAFTTSAWFRATGGAPATLLTTTGSVTAGVQVTMSEGNVTMSAVSAKNGREYTSAKNVARPGTWHHAVVVMDKRSTRLVLDGKTVVTTGPTEIDGTTGLRIGSDASGSGSFFKGDIDDVALWNRALSDKEISKLAQGARINAPRR